MIGTNSGSPLVRIAVFIDGGYLDEVSRYYKFGHERGRRISIDGLQSFIRAKVAELEHVEPTVCPVVQAHYFRGRFPAAEAEAAGKLKDQAIFDDILIRADIQQHHLPVSAHAGGPPKERGIDVRLALEAFDLASRGCFDVLALVGCDGGYAPLARKLAGLGVRTMVLAWDFRYESEDHSGRRKLKETRTSHALVHSCTYPVMMSSIVDRPSREETPMLEHMFV